MIRLRFNWQLLVGVVLSVVTLVSFRLVFVKMPFTRDVPWANLLLLVASATCLWSGVRRAIAPGRFRALRAFVGACAALFGMACLGLFVFLVLIVPRQVPASAHAPLVGEKLTDFTVRDINGAPVSLSDVLAGRIPSLATAAAAGQRPPKGVLLMFYMDSDCSACNSELHDVQSYTRAFADADILPVAISSDAPDVTGRLRQEAGYTFAFLSDPGSDLIRRLDLLNEDGTTARPADFLLDTGGTVRWRMLTSDYYVRPRPNQILAEATRLP